ncbi:hypothetical protein [Rhodococcus rhodnii]|uniref:hypothetical protein n=1 Tax=Rhodococcus rhodnii TaxID=38312 RepID=UPI0009354289|nr:hypothetical protein [Rhodococcus rhodnii]
MIDTTHPDLVAYQRHATAALELLEQTAMVSADSRARALADMAQVHATLALAAATAATVLADPV